MSPRDFDAEVVQSRLALIRDLLEDLEATGDVTSERLSADRFLRHAVERILTQLVELAVSVNSHVAGTVLGKGPVDYRSSFDLAASAEVLPPELTVRLRRSVGLRNVLTHEYVRVDLDTVARAATEALRDYGDYVEAVARWLLRRKDTQQ